RPAYMEKGRLGLVRDGTSEEGLAGAGWAMQKNALGRIDPETLEQLGMTKRQLHHLPYLIDGAADAANIVIGDVSPPGLLRLLVFRAELDFRLFGDADDPARRGADNDQPNFLETIGGAPEHGLD